MCFFYECGEYMKRIKIDYGACTLVNSLIFDVLKKFHPKMTHLKDVTTS